MIPQPVICRYLGLASSATATVTRPLAN